MKNRQCYHKNIKAFTLVELLVVISIIAMLLAVLLPSLQKARGQGQQVVCTTNLRQVGLSMLAYTTDNNGSFVRGHGGWATTSFDGKAHWIGGLLPYRGGDIKSLVCPAAKLVYPQYKTSVWGRKNFASAWIYPMVGGYENVSIDNPAPISYTMSTWITNPEQGSVVQQTNRNPSGLLTPYEYCWKTIGNVKQASSVPMFGDGRWLEAKPLSPTASRGSIVVPPAAIIPPSTEAEAEENRGGDLSYVWGIGQYAMRRHGGRVNMTFVDLSAHKVKLTELWSLKWYKSFDTCNDYVNGTKAFPAWIKK